MSNLFLFITTFIFHFLLFHSHEIEISMTSFENEMNNHNLASYEAIAVFLQSSSNLNLNLNLSHEMKRFFQAIDSVSSKKKIKYYTSRDPEMKMRFHVDDSEYDVVIFRSNKNFKFDMNKYERMHLKDHDFNTQEKITNLLEVYLRKSFAAYTAEDEKVILEGKSVLVMIHNYTESDINFSYLKKLLKDISKTHRRDLIFLHAGRNSIFYSQFNRSLSLNENEYPTFAITSLSQDESTGDEEINRYKISFSGAVPKSEEIVNWIKSWKSQDLDTFRVSEEIPENPYDSYGIMKLVRNSFQDVITNPEVSQDFFVFFCQERFEKCDQSKEIFIQVVGILKEVCPKLTFGEVNTYRNEMEFIEIKHLPELILFPDKGNRVDHMESYVGEIKIKPIIEFILKKVGIQCKKEIDNNDYKIKGGYTFEIKNHEKFREIEVKQSILNGEEQEEGNEEQLEVDINSISEFQEIQEESGDEGDITEQEAYQEKAEL